MEKIAGCKPPLQLCISTGSRAAYMNTTTRLIALSLAAALTPYEGAQQKWPTSTGTFVRGADGAINATDVSIVKSHIGTALP
jgi:hypothetical protein